MEKEKNMETLLLNYIKEAKKKYEVLGIKRDEIVDSMDDLNNEINNLRKTLQYHLKKTGRIIEGTKFSNVKNLAEACAILIKEKKEMTIKQIIKALQEGGFDFKTEKPGRALFFAIYRNPNIKKTEKGTYKWVGSKEGGENK